MSMLKLKTKLDMKDLKKVLTKEKKGKAKSLKHAGAIIRKAAQQSLTPGNGKPSRPGNPPHSQSGTLKKSILFDVDADGVLVIGPAKRSYGFYGNIHEHGGSFVVGQKKRGRKFKDGGDRKGRKMNFPKRPFMKPALENNLDKLPLSFQGRIFEE